MNPTFETAKVEKSEKFASGVQGSMRVGTSGEESPRRSRSSRARSASSGRSSISSSASASSANSSAWNGALNIGKQRKPFSSRAGSGHAREESTRRRSPMRSAFAEDRMQKNSRIWNPVVSTRANTVGRGNGLVHRVVMWVRGLGQVIWEQRENIWLMAGEHVEWVWNIVKENTWMRRMAILFVTCVILATVAVSVLIVLAVLEAALVVLASVVGVALFTCAFIVPILTVLFITGAVVSGSVVACFIFYNVINRRDEVLKKLIGQGTAIRSQINSRPDEFPVPDSPKKALPGNLSPGGGHVESTITVD